MHHELGDSGGVRQLDNDAGLADQIAVRGEEQAFNMHVCNVPRPTVAVKRSHVGASSARTPETELRHTTALPWTTSDWPWTAVPEPPGSGRQVLAQNVVEYQLRGRENLE